MEGDNAIIATTLAVFLGTLACYLVCMLWPMVAMVGATPQQLDGGIGFRDESGRVSTFVGQMKRRSSFAMRFLDTHPDFRSGFFDASDST